MCVVVAAGRGTKQQKWKWGDRLDKSTIHRAAKRQAHSLLLLLLLSFLLFSLYDVDNQKNAQRSGCCCRSVRRKMLSKSVTSCTPHCNIGLASTHTFSCSIIIINIFVGIFLFLVFSRFFFSSFFLSPPCVRVCAVVFLYKSVVMGFLSMNTLRR